MTDGFIDVHAHYLPPRYREALTAAGRENPDGITSVPDWGPAKALEMMDRVGIATAMLSVSSPGSQLGDPEKSADLARHVNDVAAELMDREPRRFGGFGSVPLPYVGEALSEIARCDDALKLDGIVLLTNYDGIYLGDARFDPVFDELEARSAVVFLHPTSPACWEDTTLGYPRPVLEFMFDTTRAVTNLIFSGTLDRCPNIKLIVPHAGAALPVLADRIAMMPFMAPSASTAADGAHAYLRRLHYDLAGPRDEAASRALLAIADESRILYGSDWPFTPEFAVARFLDSLRESEVLNASFTAIERQNAQKLFPRLRA